MGKVGRPASSAKRKENRPKDNRGLWRGAVLVVGVAAAAASGRLRWGTRGSTGGSNKTEVLDAVEEDRIRLMGSKADLEGKIEKARSDAAAVEDARLRVEKERQELLRLQAAASASVSDGVGPSVMAAQSGLIARLLELAQEVDALRGDARRVERVEAIKRVESELALLESQLRPEEAHTPMGKQQAGLIALVRSAMRSDLDGTGAAMDEDWSDDGLLKTHGLVTYASQAYWDDAYAGKRYGDSFDWYGAWEEADLNGRSLRDLVRPLVKQDARILVLGCGNSNLSALMYQDGYRNILNTDIAEAVIEHMRERHADLVGMEWRAMDAAAMDLPDGSFDLALEKGMFDALYAGTGVRVRSVLAEVRRVLRPGGRLLSVSFADDRIQRLFGVEDEGEAAEAPNANPALDCRLAGELEYRRRATQGGHRGEDGGERQEDGGKAIYIYACDRGP